MLTFRVPPCPAMALTALLHRFMTAWWIRFGSPRTYPSSSSRSSISMFEGSICRSILSVSRTASPSTRGVNFLWACLLKTSSWFTRSRAFCAALRTSLSSSLTTVLSMPPVTSREAILVYPRMVVRMLLKSWAMPPANVRTASSFCPCRVRLSPSPCSSLFLSREEMSVMIMTMQSWSS